MHPLVTRRDTCRLCGSSSLLYLFSLGRQYPSTFLELGEKPTIDPVPIELLLCSDCSLVQQRYTTPQDIIYSRHYWYRSGTNEMMKVALRDITKAIENRIDLEVGDIVLDIGSNDGTLLKSYKTEAITVGIEPAKNLAKEGKEKINCLIEDFWDYREFDKLMQGKKAKAITAIGMFYDLEDPNKFVLDVAQALDPDGLFVAQLMCAQNMLNLYDVGNLAHEHLEFYTFRSLEYLYKRNGLEIIDIETNSVNGESYRIWAAHKKANTLIPMEAKKRIEHIQQLEEGIETVKPWTQFYHQIETGKQRTIEFIKEQVYKNRKRIVVYGASTKGNVILQYYLDNENNNLIEYASDRSPEKWGKVMVGTSIKIRSEESARNYNPDYFLVLPYAFLTSFMEREKEWRGKGGKFIVPLPEFQIV